MRFLAKNPDDTEALGGRLAATLPNKNVFTAVYLTGDLGAGKTTLTRGFLRALGVTGPVRSPTYTLMEVYETPGVSIVHLDLYRLQEPTELESLGLREWARPGYVWLVEWPERGEGHLPLPDLSVTLTGGADGHEINLSGTSALGKEWVSAVENSAAGP